VADWVELLDGDLRLFHHWEISDRALTGEVGAEAAFGGRVGGGLCRLGVLLGLILFFGAELTKVIARHAGRQIVPTENAQPTWEMAKAEKKRKKGRSGSQSRARSAAE